MHNWEVNHPVAKSKDGTMTVLEHLSELRRRLLLAAAAVLAAALFCLTRVAWLRQMIAAPLEGRPLIYLSPPEAFASNLRLALIAGIVLASPVIIYQVVAFLYPALTRREKIAFLCALAGICFLFAGGVCFAYWVALPFTIIFFLQYASPSLDPQFIISDYISFFLSFHLAFGLVFQFPLLSWILGRMGLLTSAFLKRNRKYALLIILIVAAVITPPDVFSQLVMAGPLLILYEIGIIMVIISEKKRRRIGQAEL